MFLISHLPSIFNDKVNLRSCQSLFESGDRTEEIRFQ